MQQFTKQWSVRAMVVVFLLAAAFVVPPRKAEATTFRLVVVRACG